MLSNFLSTLQKYLSKITLSLTAFCMLVLGSLAITGYVSNLQSVDGSLGILRKNKVAKKTNTYISTKTLVGLGKIQASAVDPLSMVAAGPVISALGGIFGFGGVGAQKVELVKVDKNTGSDFGEALKGFLPKIGEILLGNIWNNLVTKFVGGIIGKLVGAFFNQVDKILNMIEAFARGLNGTRVAVGFLIYREIEGLTGEGSTNFLGSNDFAQKLFDKNNKASTFPKRDTLISLVADGVAWLDFMTVQRQMQADLFKDALKAEAKFKIKYGNDIKEQIKDIVIGDVCQESNNLNRLSIFRNFSNTKFNSCIQENATPIITAIEQRRQAVLYATSSKVTQYQSKLPADCKFAQYFETTKDDLRFEYDGEVDAGQLGEKIAGVSEFIQPAEIRPDECEEIKTVKIHARDQKSKALEPFNKLLAYKGDGGLLGGITGALNGGGFSLASLGDLLGTFKSSIDEFFQEFIDQAVARFEKAVSLINSINVGNGVTLYTALFDVVFNIKDKLSKSLKDITAEFKTYQKNYQGVQDAPLPTGNGSNILGDDIDNGSVG
jgi:hypothetical protein